MVALRYSWLAFILVSAFPGHCLADEASVVWYDATCRFFVVQLTEGFGLYEWKSGPEPVVSDVIEGDIGGGPEVSATNKRAGQPVALIHWGDAPRLDTLIRHSPDWCKGKRKPK